MLRALVVFSVLHAGCGRLGFADHPDGGLTVDAPDAGADAFVCVPAGHDEDADAVDDACDVCPHLADSQADRDGDRVGDACDPEPTNPRQRIVVFDPFESLDAPWAAFGGADVVGGTLRIGVANGARYVVRPHTVGTDLFVVGGMTGNAGPGARVLAITMGSSTAARYYCELYDNGLASKLQFTYTFDGSAYLFGDETPATNRTVNGAGTFRMSTSGNLATCNSTWHGESLTATGATPAISVVNLLLYAENIDASFDYFVQIHTDD